MARQTPIRERPTADAASSRAESTDADGIQGAVQRSPYQLKDIDPYSSHAVILSHLQIANHRHVLDVGAAHGYLAAILRERGFRMTGIEGDPELALEAAKNCDALVVADLDGPLPQFEEQFDVIVYGDVLEHLK